MIAPMPTRPNPCFECGQCCKTFRVSFYHGEISGFGIPDELVTRVTPHLACMRGTEAAGAAGCLALRYSAAEGYRCSIYEHRPSPCREFELYEADGSPNPRCNRLRVEAGLCPNPEQ
jgi:Fe-S-cluster containining protein